MKPNPASDPAGLRRAAEARVKERAAPSPPRGEADLRRLQQELEVHQIELEMQNEELRAAHAETAAALERYTDHFDFAPVSYLNLTADGTIRLVNLTGARLLGLERAGLLGRRFGTFVAEINRPALGDFLVRVFASKEMQSCEITLERAGRPLAVLFEATLSPDGTDCRAVLIDIAERTRVEEALRESERRYAALVNHLEGIVWEADARTFQFTFVSAFAEKLLGYPLRRWLEPNFWRNHIHPEDRESTVNYCLDSTARGVAHDFEYRMLASDGRIVWLHDLVTVETAGGKPLVLRGVMLDITERRQAEATRDESLSLTRATLESTADGILVVNAEGKIETFNRIFASMWRLSDEVLAAKDDARALQVVLDQLSEPEKFIAKVRHLYAHPQEESSDTLEFKDGRVFERYSRPQLIGAQVVGRVWSFRDITERKRAEGALQVSEEKFHALYAQSPLAVVLTTMPEGRIVDANGAAERLIGHKLVDARGQTTTELGIWVNLADRDQYLQLLHANDAMKGFESRMRRSDGAEIVVLYHGRVIHIGDKTYVLNSLLDVTERKRAEEQVRHLAAFPELNPNPVLEFNDEGSLVYHNPAAVGMAQRVGFAGLEQLLPPATRSIVVECLASGQPRLRLETKHSGHTLSWSYFPIAGQRVVHCYVGDITDRQSLEDQLRQAQKMEAVGQLAGGVAHDFNNMLTAIIGHLGLLQGNPQVTPEIAESLGEISAAANRAANLTSQLLAFSRRQVISASTLDLNEVVTHLTKMLRRILGEDVIMQLDYASEQLSFHGDAGMMEQVLVNLAVNARDAMPGGGTLKITTRSETRNHPVAEGQTATGETLACVRLSVSDTGTGIPPEIKTKIFEPFFTTKDVGKGTGLGLATVFGIVQQHHGWIEVESAVGRGTTFHIFLPRLAATPSAHTVDRPALPGRGRSELVLLVEDEPSVQELVNLALRRYGYRVLTAENGPAALEVWAKHQAEIALLFTDMVMPDGISGQQLARQLLEEKPSLKVIYSSGYNAEIAGKELKLEDGVNYLAKPYELDRLFRTVRAALDGSQSRPPF